MGKVSNISMQVLDDADLSSTPLLSPEVPDSPTLLSAESPTLLSPEAPEVPTLQSPDVPEVPARLSRPKHIMSCPARIQFDRLVPDQTLSESEDFDSLMPISVVLEEEEEEDAESCVPSILIDEGSIDDTPSHFFDHIDSLKLTRKRKRDDDDDDEEVGGIQEQQEPIEPKRQKIDIERPPKRAAVIVVLDCVSCAIAIYSATNLLF